jgi:hypothetical protein
MNLSYIICLQADVESSPKPASIFSTSTPINEPGTRDTPAIFTPTIFELQVSLECGDGDCATGAGDGGFLEFKAPEPQSDAEDEPNGGAPHCWLYTLPNSAPWYVAMTYLLLLDAQGSEPAVAAVGMLGMPGMCDGEFAADFDAVPDFDDDDALGAGDSSSPPAAVDGWGAPATTGDSLLFSPIPLAHLEGSGGDCGDVGRSPYWSPAAPAAQPAKTPCVNSYGPAYPLSAARSLQRCA